MVALNITPSIDASVANQPERLLLRAPEAAALCGIRVRTWRTWDNSGKIPRPIRMGRSTYWRIDELRAWAAAGCPQRRDWETR